MIRLFATNKTNTKKKVIKSFLATSISSTRPSAIFFRFIFAAGWARYYLFDDMMMTFKGRKDTKKDIHEGVLS